MTDTTKVGKGCHIVDPSDWISRAHQGYRPGSDSRNHEIVRGYQTGGIECNGLPSKLRRGEGRSLPRLVRRSIDEKGRRRRRRRRRIGTHSPRREKSAQNGPRQDADPRSYCGRHCQQDIGRKSSICRATTTDSECHGQSVVILLLSSQYHQRKHKWAKRGIKAITGVQKHNATLW
jgi:hypothetical protein